MYIGDRSIPPERYHVITNETFKDFVQKWYVTGSDNLKTDYTEISIMSLSKNRPENANITMLRSSRALLRSKSIDQQIEEEREKRQKEIQLLILGGASSGKSTFIKQLRLYHGDGFPDTERKRLLPSIYENLTDALNILMENMENMGIEFTNPSNKTFSKELRKEFPRWRHYHLAALSPDEGAAKSSDVCSRPISANRDIKDKLTIPDYSQLKQHFDKVKELVKDDGLQKCFQCRDLLEPPLVHAEVYFLQNLDRIAGADYLPSIQDILLIRKSTIGVQEHRFSLDSIHYRVIDVAGQKNQRKKWIHFFEGVTAVLFFVAISGYCECLEEEISTNSMQDSLVTFDDVINNRFLEKTDFILFLNKKDIFDEYLKTKNLSLCFPDYKGPNTPEACTKFIQDCFNKRKPSQKDIYCHVTCAVDRGLMKSVIDDVMQIIVDINLRLASSPL